MGDGMLREGKEGWQVGGDGRRGGGKGEGRQAGKKGGGARKENCEWICLWRTGGGREGQIDTYAQTGKGMDQ